MNDPLSAHKMLRQQTCVCLCSDCHHVAVDTPPQTAAAAAATGQDQNASTLLELQDVEGEVSSALMKHGAVGFDAKA